MLQDRHLIYPHQLAHDDVINRITAVFKRSPNWDVFGDPRFGIPNLVHRVCLEYDLNPAWVLISLQRERGLLRAKADSINDWNYACGYVGQDGPGTVNTRWNGLGAQLWLCIHQTAWIAGFGPPWAYGVKENLRPGVNRWDPAKPSRIQLYTLPNVKGDLVLPGAMHEHVVFSYTPHAEALPTAGEILHDTLPEFE